jgi:zinc transport system ATP-binding protein
MIKLSNVTVKKENNIILEDINLEINKGDFLAILGPNGGGKTTLVKLILGFLKPSSGDVVIDEELNVGYVPQFKTFNNKFPIRVFDVILSGRIKNRIRLFKRYDENDKKEALKVLKLLGIEELKDRKISKLSGGETQKVLIARALVANPDLIILDEPTASLDKSSKTEIHRILKKLNENVTIIIVSHDTHVISKYTDKIFCVNKRAHCHVDTKEHFEEVYGEDMEVIKHRELEGHDE